MRLRRAFLAFLVTACLLALVGLAPVSIRAQYSYQDKVLGIESASLIAYWGLDESSGTNANDLTANNNDGTYAGVTLSSQAPADPAWVNAPVFDGINDLITVPSIAIDNRSFSLSVWFRPAASPPATQTILSAAASPFGANKEVRVLLYSTGQVAVDFVGSSVGTAVGAVTFGAGWYHLGYTYDFAGDTSTFYLNGTQIQQNNVGPMTSTSPTWEIGRNVQSVGAYYKGAQDEIAVWQTDLTAGDMGELADPSGLPTPTPTQTNTPTVTPTLEFGSHIILSSGQVGALYYKIDSGSVLLALLLLLQIGLLLALLALRMWRRA